MYDGDTIRRLALRASVTAGGAIKLDLECGHVKIVERKRDREYPFDGKPTGLSAQCRRCAEERRQRIQAGRGQLHVRIYPMQRGLAVTVACPKCGHRTRLANNLGDWTISCPNCFEYDVIDLDTPLQSCTCPECAAAVAKYRKEANRCS